MELNFSDKTINRTGNVVNAWLWENVAGDGTINFAVVQIGPTLYFYDAGVVSGLSAGALTPTIDLTPFSPAGAPSPATLECQFSAGMGYLFVSHPNLESFSVSYDPVALTFTATQITLQIRDFKGLKELGVATDTRPGSLTTAHTYNLQNQSWAFNTAYYATFKTNLAVYPSNADIWWAYKNTSDVFDTTQVANVSLGNSPAPRGHYIVNPYNVDRSTVSGVAGITVETTGYQRASTNAFFAGRVFYAGVSAQGFNSRIYFSQICTSDAQFGLCMQSNDPTAESAFDLLSSDGGVIQIPDAGTIIKLIAMEGALVAFCTNGCWSIQGSNAAGFSANDYTVKKITSVRTISATSFVSVMGYPCWWNADGIYAMANKNGVLAVDSMTDLKIKDWFASIPLASKGQAKGVYNSLTHVIQWTYRSTIAASVEETEQFDKILNFNVLSGAFYPWSISPGVQVHNTLVVQAGSGQLSFNTVLSVAPSNVLDALGNQVVSYNIANKTIHPVSKFLVSRSNGSGSFLFTWAECQDITYTDWTSTGVNADYSSFFVSGYKILGEGQRKIQGNYVYVYSDDTVPTSYLFQGVFDFGSSSLSNQISTRQTVVNGFTRATNSNAYSYAHRKLKVRGQGVSLQLEFSSVRGQPFNVVGWSIWVTGNSSI
ncbi:hypothetical protein SAMN05444169_7600 [Bradyrhizobium erythrophlei]|uniref:Uncharacterized protein n=2 Tax=Bradyrhizobium erythrophlei TaxID=1437360 RepID=A0A1M5T7M9_9BRAD|nr:hypothetical protein SAMN05444169_7600 [Bradyrhizobium erythrophlei]